MKTDEKSEMPNVLKCLEKEMSVCVCGQAALEKINFPHSSPCENRKFLKAYFTDKLFQLFPVIRL